MEKHKIIVPKGIRYLSEWKEFKLPENPSIIDKQITGCGFTEFCITNPNNVILVSPRKILLENKLEQHPGEVFYATTGLEKTVDFEKDLTNINKRVSVKKDKERLTQEELNEAKKAITKLKNNIQLYYYSKSISSIPCKILVTYDSFRHVKEALGENIKNFYIVIDEFQSIFTDSKFKSSTEIEFLDHVHELNRVCFVSATPMLDKYLEMLDEFKNLPFYELDWETEDPSRVLTPKLSIHSCSRSIMPAASKIIQSYLSGEFETTIININGEMREVESKEAVLYVNSVKNICDVIGGNKLTLDNTNILCSRTPDNEEKIRKAFGLKKSDLKVKGVDSVIGSVPTKGQPHKMFTLCTRTVYLGADFYSTNARTFIFSDANVDSLTVDISLDLPQILGRQRLESNPWKNRADLYYRTLTEGNILTEDELVAIVDNKKRKTENLLSAYNEVSNKNKHDLAETYQYVAKTANYKDNYVAVNEHGGSDLLPVFNNLMMVADMRCYEIQQIDYKDRFRVFNNFSDNIDDFNSFIQVVKDIEDNYINFTDKMKYIYSLDYSPNLMKLILDNLTDPSFAKYYYSISPSRAGTLGYQRGNLEKEYKSIKSFSVNFDVIINEIKSKFKVGERYSKSYIKETLKIIYESNGYNKTPKANDLEEYFDIKTCRVLNESTNKRDAGFEIIRKKE